MSTADGRDELADRLYALPPAGFVAARDEAVAGAKRAGDRAGAAAIGALRRPTVAAWLVNLLALRRPESLDELLALGAEIGVAQQNLRGAELRELSTRRRAAISKLVAQAADLAVQAGATRAGLPTAEVEATLTGALADPDMARDIRSGRLLKPGHYDGFGGPSRPELQVIEGGRTSGSGTEPRVTAETVPGDTRTTPKKARAGGKTRASEKARREQAKRDEAAAALTEATARSTAAESAYDAVAERVEDAAARVTGIEERLTELRRERAGAHNTLAAAQRELDAADAERRTARRKQQAAERAAKRAITT